MTALLTPEIFHHMNEARKDDMTKQSFISRLLGGADLIEDRPVDIESIDEPGAGQSLAIPDKAAHKPVLAVEHAHGVIERAIAAHRSEEARLLDEINVRMEELRQVRVALDALGSAYAILHSDREKPATAPPMK